MRYLLLTPFLILATHYLSVLAHEYAHSFSAWIVGFKANPLSIHFGGTSWLNLITLININENVDYEKIFASNHTAAAAWIAFAGIGINLILYAVSLYFLKRTSTHNKPFYYFFFWFNFMNLANIYAYVPCRVFGSHGDLAIIIKALNLSPWVLFITLGYLIVFILWYFFAKTLPDCYQQLFATSKVSKYLVMVICVILLFGYFGMAGFIGYGEVPHFLSALSLIAIPLMIILNSKPLFSPPSLK